MNPNPPVLLSFQNELVFATIPEYPTGDYCYVAGPMSGYPGYNYASFDEARNQLVEEGWSVINPADLDRINLGIDFSIMKGDEDLSVYGTAFARQDISSLLLVDAVFLLPGWQASRGANNEAMVATMLGVPCFDYVTREVVPFAVKFSNADKTEVRP